MFESINEPQFNSEPETKLATINKTFYDIVRTSGGNNATRMLVLPTLNTNDSQDKCDALYQQIIDLNDKNIIATFHYYSEWVYSANLGKTRFDEDLWGDGNTTAKTSLVASFDRMYNTFTANGIGVICGEYGLLGFDNSDYCNENGEVLKYLEYINYYAKEKGICLMLWDNGQHMNRTSLTWNNESFGNMIEASMKERSSYATDLDYIFVTKENKAKDVSIPLTLNGNTLVSIYNGSKKLVKGTDYTIKDGTAILKGSYISKLIKGSYGVKATLTFKFSAGADWNEYISYVGTPSLGKVKGTTSDTISIPTKFNGDILEKAVSKNSAGTIVSNNTWWNYLQYDSEFTADYNKNTINLLNNYVKLLSDDTYTLTFTFYSGQVLEYKITVKDSKITSSQVSTTTTSKKYTLKLNVNGGKKLSTSSITVTSGDKYGTLPTPTRKGYTFKGWYTKKNGGTKITKSSTVTITKNTTLYAHWSKNSKK